MAACILGANALVFLSLVLASRALGPDDYGIVGAMLGLVLILSVPSYSFQTHLAREVSTAASAGHAPGEVRALMGLRMRQALGLAAAFTLAGLAATWPLQRVLDLDDPGPLLVTVVAAIPLLAMTVLRGVLLGLQRFAALGANILLEGAARLGLMAVVLALGAGATGASAAPLAGVTAAAAAAWLSLGGLSRPEGEVRPPVLPGLTRTVAFFAAFAALTNVDVLIARARLGATEAGEYAGAAFFGKIVLLVPVAVTVVLVPKVAARATRGRPSMDLLVASLAFGLGACGLVTLVAFAVPGLVIDLSLGDEFRGAEELLGPYGIAMTAFAGLLTCALHSLASGRYLVTWMCVAAVPAEVVVLLVASGSGLAMAWAMAGFGLALFALAAAVAVTTERRAGAGFSPPAST